MEESTADSKPKARKISVPVSEQPSAEPVAPAPLDEKTRKKRLRNAYVYIAIGVGLVIVSSFDIYAPGARGQGALGLLIVGGLWLAYGIYSYIRSRE